MSTPGKYRMTAEVSVDDHGFLYPHDTAQMFLAEWWTKRGAVLVSLADHETMLAGRRAEAVETERLRARTQELQAEVNHLRKLLDERDATDRATLPAPVSSSEDTPAPRVWSVPEAVPQDEPHLTIRDADGDTAIRVDAGLWRWTRVSGFPVDRKYLPHRWPDPELQFPVTEVLAEVPAGGEPA